MTTKQMPTAATCVVVSRCNGTVVYPFIDSDEATDFAFEENSIGASSYVASVHDFHAIFAFNGEDYVLEELMDA